MRQHRVALARAEAVAEQAAATTTKAKTGNVEERPVDQEDRPGDAGRDEHAEHGADDPGDELLGGGLTQADLGRARPRVTVLRPRTPPST